MGTGENITCGDQCLINERARTFVTFAKGNTFGFYIFRFASCGNIDGIQTLFSQGLASPFDGDNDDGKTALHASTSSLNFMIMMLTVASIPIMNNGSTDKTDMIRFQIHMKADLAFEDKAQQ